ncbi:bifunctional RNase H/acid phosphatase [Pseudonocardia nigra]|uniref:bifunctional RNase H/acid phosphatase n=1 Tax=Pseudonocardia nigra TaxID=1921578 RepID=UPI001C5D8CFC
MIVEADGGSRGNPGPAGYGAVVLDAATEEVLVERAEGIGVATNNVAEYQGLIAGLRAALQLGATDVEVRMDSKLVVEQMSGRWQVKHPAMKPLALEAGRLIRELGSVQFGWIPRARNAKADALANQAMDAQAGVAPAAPAASARVEPASTRPASATWTGQVGEPTRLLLLRHGQTELSVQRRYSGHGDPELTDLGHRQAAGAAARLGAVPGIAAVLSSPLRRARQTAAAVAEATGAPLVVRDGLIETDFGAWEGLTFAEARERDPELHASWLGSEEIAPPGGESFAAVGTRVEAERAAIVEEYPAATVVVVSHVTPIKMLLRDALQGGPGILYRLHLDPGSLSEASFYPDGGASVRLVNDTSFHPGER